MDKWLICTVMALYTEACTVIKTDSGLSEGWSAFQDADVMAPTMEQLGRCVAEW